MLEVVTIASLFVMFMAILVGVLDRFLLGLGLPWPEELARFLLIWASLLSAAVAAKRHQHFQLTIVARLFGAMGANLIDLIGIATLSAVIWYGIKITLIFHVQTSPSLGIPMSWVYAAVPVSCALIAGYLVRDIFVRTRDRRATKQVR